MSKSAKMLIKLINLLQKANNEKKVFKRISTKTNNEIKGMICYFMSYEMRKCSQEDIKELITNILK